MSVPARHFRMRSARALHDAHFGPNMTPMVDVVMVILVFFMASAALLGPEWFVKTSLPKSSNAALKLGQTPPTRIVIRLEVAQGGTTAATMTTSGGNEDSPASSVGPMPIAEAMDVLRERAAREGTADLVVIIDPAAQVPYEDVVSLHAFCHGLEIGKVGLGLPE